MLQAKVKILSNKRLGRKYFHCLLQAPAIARGSFPGQFINVKIDARDSVFLRRPFSIHRVKDKNIEILYEVVGPATKILSQKKKGEHLDIIGPLGNGFNYELPATNYQLPILVAGGMGVAPLIFLAEEIVGHHVTLPVPALPAGRRQAGKSPRHRMAVLIGAKNKESILCEKGFQKLGCDVKIATDDGSRGFKGRVTELLQRLLSTIDHRPSTIYACGPRPMLQEISRLAKKYHLPAQISLEEHMSCGIGACMGCVVNTKDGYQRVCKEGPVLEADKIIW